MERPYHQTSVLKRTLNVLAWALIALLLVATLWAVQWARKQPTVHSIWGDPSDQPLTLLMGGRLYRIVHMIGFRVFKENDDSNWN